MSTRRDRLNAIFSNQHEQARRALLADTSGRTLTRAQRRSDKRAIEAVARAIRAGRQERT
jgi:hypothetical protein